MTFLTVKGNIKDMKLLVTGVSGFLGWHISRAALRSWQVVGTYNHTMPQITGVDTHALDLCDSGKLIEFMDEVKPDAVIHAAALSQPNACEVQPELSEAINVGATRCLAKWCGNAGVPMLFTSTDLVFDGEHAPYSEGDAVGPISVYGRHKVAAERIVVDNVPLGLVCRMPLMFGYRAGKPASFIGPWYKKLSSGEGLILFDDEIRTPVSGTAAAEGLLFMLESGVFGVLHLGGRERISRYAFGLRFAEVFGLSADSITAGKIDDIKMASPRVRDVSLDSSRAFQLGYTPETIKDQLIKILQESSFPFF